MRKTKFLFTLFAAFCVMAFSAQAASALSITGSTPFTGQQVSATQVFNIGTAVRVTCTTASISNGTLNSPNTLGTPSTNMARFTIAYGNCTATIAGITSPASVTIGCKWEVAPSTYSGGSGAGVVRVCGTNLSIPSLGCVITVPSQTISSGVTYQNVSPNVNVIAAIPGGASGIQWTQNGNCPGINETYATGPVYAGYQGTIRANGLTVVP